VKKASLSTRSEARCMDIDAGSGANRSNPGMSLLDLLYHCPWHLREYGTNTRTLRLNKGGGETLVVVGGVQGGQVSSGVIGNL
jgi:hypothetical protein